MSSDDVMARRAHRCGCRAVIGLALLSLVVSPAFAEVASEPTVAAVPVMVGDGRELDACGSVAVVSGLNPRGANALSVRSGPALHYARVDTVPSGQILYICGQEDHWYAVVYPRGDEDCGVSEPIYPETIYVGPCRQGWVYDAYVTLIAS